MKIRMRKIIWFANVSISSTVRPMKNSETRRERSEQAEKDSFKKMNSDKLMSTSGREVIVSASFNNIRRSATTT